MKTFFVSTHRVEEFDLVSFPADKGYIDEVFGQKRLIVVKNSQSKELPKLSFSNDETVILLCHGYFQNVIQEYSRAMFSFIHNCGTGGETTTKSDNRKSYELLLNEPLSKFDEVWYFFYASVILDTKLDFLHDIHDSKIVADIPKVLQREEVITAFEHLKNKKYNNNDEAMRENLKKLRDAVLKIR